MNRLQVGVNAKEILLLERCDQVLGNLPYTLPEPRAEVERNLMLQCDAAIVYDPHKVLVYVPEKKRLQTAPLVWNPQFAV